jgi:leucyl aminopeptidase
VTQLQIPPRLTIEALPAAGWDGAFLITPEIAQEKPAPDKPGKKAGDTILVSGEPLIMHVSLGVGDKLSTANLRKAGIAAAGWLTGHQVADAGLKAAAFDDLGIEGALDAFCEGLLLGAFHFDRHKSKDDDSVPVVVHLLTDGDEAISQAKVARISGIVDGVNLAREWSHEPPNIINPVTLVERAQALASETDLKCEIFGGDELAEMGAGAILSVGLGSKTPSQMIIFEHPGHGAGAGSQPVVVVGKAITFDTGGYSLKPTKGMLGMKFDKCGGMTVIGIMKAVAALNLPLPVVGIVAAAENMISSYAYRPSDIITSLSGKTIEIISTDAEGRMVLSDALTYARTELNPRAIIDLATLTGGVVTALGKVRAGLMSNDDTLAETLAAAGDRTDERLWRLPLDEEYFELIKGSDSDLKNSAGVPQASSIVGGTFLKQFVMNEVPWAHIDIAGMATEEKGAKGGRSATGFGVRLVLDYLEHLSNDTAD